MAEKYRSWDKKMLTFTVPSRIKGKTIKKGRYTKLKDLLELRAYLSKQFNNTKLDMKYFMVIELGKAYSNPHLHIQCWIKPMSTASMSSSEERYAKDEIVMSDSGITSSQLDLIKKKAIAKFDLQEERCATIEPTTDTKIYHYVIKDYAKGLSDKQIWDIETQKTRMRKQIGLDRLRWYSKSGDKYTQKLYRFTYRVCGVLRKYANEFIDKFFSKFLSMFSVREIPQQKCFGYLVSNLLGYRTRRCLAVFSRFLDIILAVLYACRSPPYSLL